MNNRYQQQTKREPTAQERLAHFQLKKQQEYQQEQALKAQAAQEQAQEQAKQEQEAQRAQLEALRQQRLERETFEAMTPEETKVYQEQNDPKKVISDLAAKARRQEEEEFAAKIAREYEQELRSQTGGAVGQRGQRLREAEQHRNEKAQAFLKARELRELQAETQSDPLQRMVHSLGDRAREVLVELTNNQPGAMERAQAAKQTVQKNKVETLKAEYLRELQDNFTNGFIPRHVAHKIQDKYIEKGLNIYAQDVAEAVMKLKKTY
jgi:hypothetical protein